MALGVLYEQAAQKAAQSATESDCQRETAVLAENGNGFVDKDLHLTSSPVNAYEYPQGDSNPCLSRERDRMVQKTLYFWGNSVTILPATG